MHLFLISYVVVFGCGSTTNVLLYSKVGSLVELQKSYSSLLWPLSSSLLDLLVLEWHKRSHNTDSIGFRGTLGIKDINPKKYLKVILKRIIVLEHKYNEDASFM